jgi:hypothetical protein
LINHSAKIDQAADLIVGTTQTNIFHGGNLPLKKNDLRCQVKIRNNFYKLVNTNILGFEETESAWFFGFRYLREL